MHESRNEVEQFLLSKSCDYLIYQRQSKHENPLIANIEIHEYVQVARGLNRGAFELKLLTDESPDKVAATAISVLRPKEIAPQSSSPRLTLYPIKKWKTTRK